MKTKQTFILLTLSLALGIVLSSCTSNEGFEGTRKEYEYVPPVPTPTPTPIPLPGTVIKGGQEVEPEKKKSFFGRLFSKDGEEKSGGTVARVGDSPDMLVNEEGELVPQNQPSEHVYRLKIGDILFINLTGSGGLDEEIQTQVDDEGAIKLRFIGAVKAKDLSSTELEREIEAEYTERQKIYKEVTVRVTVPNTVYSIGGEVRNPGRFPLVGRVTLSQAIVAAGNFTEWVDEKDITLVRNKEKVTINFKKIRENPNLDVELLAGDWIWVGRSTF